MGNCALISLWIVTKMVPPNFKVNRRSKRCTNSSKSNVAGFSTAHVAIFIYVYVHLKLLRFLKQNGLNVKYYKHPWYFYTQSNTSPALQNTRNILWPSKWWSLTVQDGAAHSNARLVLQHLWIFYGKRLALTRLPHNLNLIILIVIFLPFF